MIVNVIKETMNQMRLKVSNLRGQCYDGAAVMASHKNGVAAKIKEENLNVFMHIVTVML